MVEKKVRANISEEIALKRKKFTLGSGWGVFLVFVAECIILSILSPYFLKVSNIFNVLKSISFIGITSIGMTMLIITGAFDLSVGSVAGLGGMVTAALITKVGVNPVLSLLTGIATGIFIGFFMATLVNKLGINAFIVTLGMLSIARGFTYLIAKGSNIFIKSKGILFLGQGYLGKVPVPVILMAILVVIGSLFLRFTVFGRYIYAVGGNERAARLAGIQVNKIRLIVFMICSSLAAFSGIVVAGMLGSAEMTAGTGLELDVIAAVIIGGTSLSGGKGTVVGSLIGAAIMGVLRNGFVLLGIPYEVQVISIGVVIILAVVFDSLKSKRR